MMKRASVVAIVLGMLFSFRLMAQNAGNETGILVTLNKTTSLIFPFAVKSADKGSRDILIQKAPGTENVLQVKAAKENFEPTNLTVIVADGRVYTFNVFYHPRPPAMTFFIGEDERNASSHVIFPASRDKGAIEGDPAWKIAWMKGNLHGPGDAEYQISMKLSGLYVKDDVLYFRFQFNNRSNLSYQVDQLRFFVCDRKKSKRTTYQQLELSPAVSAGNTDNLPANSSSVAVIGIPKFTLAQQKYLSIELTEKNGGRNLKISLKNRQLIKATPLKEN